MCVCMRYCQSQVANSKKLREEEAAAARPASRTRLPPACVVVGEATLRAAPV
jgi:hypothetical protein